MDALPGGRQDELLQRVSLRDENRDAITQHKGPLGSALTDIYAGAITWADDRRCWCERGAPASIRPTRCGDGSGFPPARG